MRKQLELRVKSEDGVQTLCSPLVGRFFPRRAVGEVLAPGAVVGHVLQLREEVELVVPQGGLLRVMRRDLPERDAAVAYNQALFAVRPVDASDADDASGADAAASEGGIFFESPMAGQFFRRPSPDDPPFVEVGQALEAGQQVGLVEVMKFFYPLNYDGPAGMVVDAIVTEDATSIEAGDAILKLRKA